MELISGKYETDHGKPSICACQTSRETHSHSPIISYTEGLMCRAVGRADSPGLWMVENMIWIETRIRIIQ